MNDEEWERESKGERELMPSSLFIHPPTAPPVVVFLISPSVLHGKVLFCFCFFFFSKLNLCQMSLDLILKTILKPHDKLIENSTRLILTVSGPICLFAL